MRTAAHRITSPAFSFQDKRDEKSSLAPLSEEPTDISARSSQSGEDSTPRKQNDHIEDDTPTKKKGKSEQLLERHPRRHKRGKGPPGNPPQRQDTIASNSSSKSQVPLAWETPKFAATSGKIVLFMPFLHYETDERRRKMSQAIRHALKRDPLPENPSKDSLIMSAYVNCDPNLPRLHPRRTLDQFFYHGIDTSARDTDQVVYRYCKRNGVEPKVFMVDQLWLWIIGKDLIITCFPQRWDQPKQDPLNVLDGIIEETNAKTRPPIGSVYDLAMLITSRCSGTFDRHRFGDQEFQFLDMFEHSIGLVTDRESQLFSRFNHASAQSAKWLQYHRRRRSLGRTSRLTAFGSPRQTEGGMEQFPDALLDIGVETSLLAEIKDIRDELSIIAVILDAQYNTLADLEIQITEELRGEGPATTRRTTDAAVAEIRKRSREQLRGLEVRQKDIVRMDQQAQSLYMNLTDLLDLKQKHSNALEARFAGDQAVIAAKQGQTIMVFTIVTIIFLPMSFIAAFFAINLEEWSDSGTPLTIPYVSKYMFGIGLGVSLPLIAMAFAVTDISDAARGLFGGGGGGGWWSRWFGSSSNKEKRFSSSKGRSSAEGGNADDPQDETLVLPLKDAPSSMRAAGPSLEYANGNATRMRSRHSRERSDERYAASRLSPVSGHRGSGGPRKVSFGSANAGVAPIPWGRPSLDRARGRRMSEDLEKGRGRYV
ncbi:hypothetical protein F5Y04DRAFT_205022 [Hypomontagnella monticulosa]|nr:hypothetical protein F5Y04DRAFT_205022 [Hypomontagnella monticulosa]